MKTYMIYNYIFRILCGPIITEWRAIWSAGCSFDTPVVDGLLLSTVALIFV